MKQNRESGWTQWAAAGCMTEAFSTTCTVYRWLCAVVVVWCQNIANSCQEPRKCLIQPSLMSADFPRKKRRPRIVATKKKTNSEKIVAAVSDRRNTVFAIATGPILRCSALTCQLVSQLKLPLKCSLKGVASTQEWRKQPHGQFGTQFGTQFVHTQQIVPLGCARTHHNQQLSSHCSLDYCTPCLYYLGHGHLLWR